MAYTWKTEGFILKRTAFKEADRIVTLYTKDSGKISVQATGIRKITSKLAGHCEPFMYSRFFIARGKTFDRLAGSLTHKAYPLLRSSYEHISVAKKMTHSIDMFTKEGQHDDAVFQALENGFDFLNQIQQSRGRLWLYFHAWQWKLFDILGIKPQLDECVVGRHAITGTVFFDVHNGGTACQEHHHPAFSLTLNPTSFELLKKSLQFDFQALSQEAATKTEWQTYASVIRAFYDYHAPRRSAPQATHTTITVGAKK
ncbi:MAG: DNA repair protein RecO [Candidatus Kerfeldbacteria bacterium RIFCSPHIGHO2_12_FULL_48_17]|uniref:DNA repair protein RecO n=1 Tax=Candidatus Kerfeldbacteria bacterium RIFCSPHIGHO2_12_FULL_48_17 TaxID=1798542 RepID=A0A1G2B8G1_9BACT|nr:MAG: DNA repair protein RecO [Candidatus Kerfeldbacteria bacterium RIFCSPHIGHO2_12_FULL_48_17]